MSTKLISRKHVKDFALAVAGQRAHKFTRVGGEFFIKVEANVKEFIRCLRAVACHRRERPSPKQPTHRKRKRPLCLHRRTGRFACETGGGWKAGAAKLGAKVPAWVSRQGAGRGAMCVVNSIRHVSHHAHQCREVRDQRGRLRPAHSVGNHHPGEQDEAPGGIPLDVCAETGRVEVTEIMRGLARAAKVTSQETRSFQGTGRPARWSSPAMVTD